MTGRPRNTNPEDLYVYFHDVATDALDTVTPVKSKSVLNKVRAPWFSEDLLTLRREVRRLEINWRKSQLEIDRQMFVLKRVEYSSRCDAVKSANHRTRIEDADNKKLFAIVAELSDSRTGSSNAMPNNIPMKEIPSTFMNYFENKLSNFRDRIGVQPHSCEIDVHNDVMPTHTLAQFDPVSPGDIIALVKQSSPKSCELDILPHGVLKNCIHILAPFLADLFNNSFTTGIVQIHFKSAIIRPLLKKKYLDKNILKNYRPVSNLPFLSKVLKRAAVQQLNHHLNKFNLFTTFQGAYRANHST
ncbi:uncharacterized protein [Ptychodera flava]|uniref:uncharacterized protein n=1 Tax=Ptychodera flava TaxID=63121 RepID=UPI00396A3448